MIKTNIYILWDEDDGYNFSKLYADEESAKIGLYEQYLEYRITVNKSKIEKINLVSYVNKNFNFLI